MTYEIFIGLFLVLAIADWWMDMVQRTTAFLDALVGAAHLRPHVPGAGVAARVE